MTLGNILRHVFSSLIRLIISYAPIINLPDCIILDNLCFENFILMVAAVPFTKALGIFKTCELVNNNLFAKLVSSLELPIKFDERFKITSVPFFYCKS